MNYKDEILETRKIFDSRPEDHMEHDRLVPPDWMKEYGMGQFEQLFEDQDVLFSEGRVVWASLVQANTLLFDSGPHDLPAVVLYSLDEGIDSKPKLIRKVAKGLFKIKGKQTDPDIQKFADMLKSDRTKKWKVPVPLRISNDIQCFYTTALIIRNHLPNGYLSKSLFPYLVCPEKTKVATILPSRYWSEKFFKKW